MVRIVLFILSVLYLALALYAIWVNKIMTPDCVPAQVLPLGLMSVVCSAAALSRGFGGRK